MNSTITITVNVATGNKYEGDAKLEISLPEKHIKYLDRNKLASELDTLLDKALADYNKRNSQ